MSEPITVLSLVLFALAQFILVGFYSYKKFYAPVVQQIRNRKIDEKRRKTIKLVK